MLSQLDLSQRGNSVTLHGVIYETWNDNKSADSSGVTLDFPSEQEALNFYNIVTGIQSALNL